MNRVTMLADAGTSFLWLMLFGFLCILADIGVLAVLQAWIIRRWFKPEGKGNRVFGIMVLSNLFSVLAGLFLLPELADLLLERWAREDALYILPWLLAALYIVTYFLALILEWPFCLWAVGPRKARLAVSIKAALATQTASYIVILLYLLLPHELFSAPRARADPMVVSWAPDIAEVYYLSRQDGSLCKIRLNGTGRQKILDTNYPQKRPDRAKLFLGRKKGESSWGLWIENDRMGDSLLVPNVAQAGGLAWKQTVGKQVEEGGPFDWRWIAASLGPADDQAWSVKVITGLRAENKKTGQEVQLGLAAPFVHWSGDNPSLLPGDFVVFELEGRIVLVDLNTRRFGQIAMGRQPVVVVDESAVPHNATTRASAKTSSQP